MADPEPPASVGGSAITPQSASTKDHILLNVLSPSPEVTNNGRITFENISLETTVSELKERIQNYLPTHPAPVRQRLIYRGHALLNSEATLRQIFQPSQSNADAAFTLHLVIPQQTSSSGAVPPSRPVPAAPVNGIHPPVPGTGLPQVNQQMPANLQQAVANAHQAHQMVQQQFNAIQQQMVGIMGAHHPHHQHHHPVPGGQVHMTYQIQGVPRPMPFLPNFIPGDPNLQTMLGHQQAMRAQAAMQAPQPPNVANAAASLDSNQTPAAASSMPARPASVPLPSSIPTIQMSVPPVPGRSEQQSRHPVQPFPNNHLPYPFSMQQRLRPVQPNTTPTTAWLLNSPNGPEALLFAPGHGYFSSPSRAAVTPTTSAQSTASEANVTSPPTATQTEPANVANRTGPTRGQDQAPPAPQLAVARRDQGRNQNANQEGNDDDMMHFVLQRGWLFLRLYMFILVFSQANSWRRWLLLGLATLVCCLPRNNPFQTALVRARRHIDSLIGPPTPIVPPPAQPNAEGQPAAAGGSSATPRLNPTPEQAAARILQQRQQQEQEQPNILRNALFRLERAVALFLASLVPGVGERHIRAREEATEAARRAIETAEAARRRQEEEQQQQAVAAT